MINYICQKRTNESRKPKPPVECFHIEYFYLAASLMAKKPTIIGNYHLLDTIGEGNFAKVKLGMHLVTKQQVAIKIIDKTNIEKDTFSKLNREIRAMKGLSHPNIVKLYEVMETSANVFLVMEYCSGGELYNHIVNHSKMKEAEARKYFRQIVFAVEYCHSKNVIHRDIKVENLLLDHNMDIKVADFGFTNNFKKDKKLMTWCGSPPYAAPELFIGKAYTGPEVDVWSMGVVLFVLVCGELPFKGDTIKDVRKEVLKCEITFPSQVSSDCEHLIKKILVVNSESRYKIPEIMAHKWFKEGIDIQTERAKYKKLEAARDEVAAKTEFDCFSFGISPERLKISKDKALFDEVYAMYHLMLDKKTSELLSDTSKTSILSNKYTAEPMRQRKLAAGQPQQQILKSVNILEIQKKLEEYELGSDFKDSNSILGKGEAAGRKITFATDLTNFQDLETGIKSLVNTLNVLKIPYQKSGDVYYCILPNLEFELQLKKQSGQNLVGLRHRRSVGDVLAYKIKCQLILQNLQNCK